MRLPRHAMVASAALASLLVACTNGSGLAGVQAMAYGDTVLVSNRAGIPALHVDANLLNPWGIVFGPGLPVWVANNNSQTSTVYDGNGVSQGTFNIPNGSGGAPSPAGIVYNGGTGFVVSKNGHSGPATFIFAGEGGTVTGWSYPVDPANAVVAYDDVAVNGANAAVYKGLAMATNGGATLLYAADFHNAKVDVFNTSFSKVTTTAGFVDASLPAGYAPFGIQAIADGAGGTTQLYVTYAQQDTPKHDPVKGAGLGLVNVFTTDGVLVTHLIPVGGKLNAPWGVALAPADFGPLSGTLLIGNFGDGLINAYAPATGAFVNNVHDSAGVPFAAPGLWGLAFGNDAQGLSQPHNTLFYAAGLNNEADGVYGRLDVVTTTSGGGPGY